MLRIQWARGFGQAARVLAVVGLLLGGGSAQAAGAVQGGSGGHPPAQTRSIARIVPFAAPASRDQSISTSQAGAIPASIQATPLPTAAPDSTPLAPAPTGSGNSPDPWRWWLVGVMVLLGGFFLLRGLRRQRRR